MRKCPDCGEELTVLKLNQHTGHIKCPHCREIIIRRRELNKMTKFERRLNFCDVKVKTEKEV